MPRYLFSSHDGFGLGHVRRNFLIASAIIADDPTAEVALVTGLAVRPPWLDDPRLTIVPVPPLLKNSRGEYRSTDLSFEGAIEERSRVFRAAIESFRPDVVIVDRHPYGTGGELLPGLRLAKDLGAGVVLGLRDVLDEPARVREELAGDGWRGVAEIFDEVLVYGGRILCDHRAEYGLPVEPRYCGWVVEHVPSRPRQKGLIAVTAGGGGDGHAVFGLGVGLAHTLRRRHIVLVAGPYAADPDPGTMARARSRLEVVRDVPGCVALYARAEATVQMAGYNSTVESLAAGLRPVLVPRRSPRREQAIRAIRLAGLGLADVVDENAEADEVAWLVERDRTLDPAAIAAAGIDLDGADTAATALRELARVPQH